MLSKVKAKPYIQVKPNIAKLKGTVLSLIP